MTEQTRLIFSPFIDEHLKLFFNFLICFLLGFPEEILADMNIGDYYVYEVDIRMDVSRETVIGMINDKNVPKFVFTQDHCSILDICCNFKYKNTVFPIPVVFGEI